MAPASVAANTSLSITLLPSSGRQAMRSPDSAPWARAASTKPEDGAP